MTRRIALKRVGVAKTNERVNDFYASENLGYVWERDGCEKNEMRGEGGGECARALVWPYVSFRAVKY